MLYDILKKNVYFILLVRYGLVSYNSHRHPYVIENSCQSVCKINQEKQKTVGIKRYYNYYRTKAFPQTENN
jgi:hypothetical protein